MGSQRGLWKQRQGMTFIFYSFVYFGGIWAFWQVQGSDMDMYSLYAQLAFYRRAATDPKPRRASCVYAIMAAITFP